MSNQTFVPNLGGRPATLREALEDCYNADRLREFARALNIAGPTRKVDLAAAVAEVMLGGEGTRALADLHARLTEIERAAVAETLYDPDRILDLARFRAKYGSLPEWPSFERAGGKVKLLGLFVMPGAVRGQGRAQFLPEDLSIRLRAFVPPPREETLASIPEPVPVRAELTLVVAETEDAAVREIFSVLQLVDRGGVPVSAQTRRPAQKGVDAVREVLVGGDFYVAAERTSRWHTDIGPIRAYAWPLIVQAAGLASAAGSKLALTAAGRRALSQAPAQILQHAWKKWIANSIFDELSRIEAIKGQSDRKRLTAVAGRREAIVDALTECPVGAWITIGELSRHMRASGNGFDVVHNPWDLYISDRNYGSLGYDGNGGWDVLQERYMMAFLLEYAATLGVVDVACTTPEDARPDFRSMWGTDDLAFLSRYDGLSCIRLTRLGAFVLGLVDDVAAPPTASAGRLKILPNLHVVPTDGDFDARDEAFLSTFCRRGAGGFALEPTLVAAAVEKGHRLGDLAGFLEDACEGGLPAGARAFFEDMAHRAAMLSITSHALLIECADSEVGYELARDRRTKRLCTVTADGSVIVVPSESEAAFRRAVREMGYPLLVGGDR
ncbi:MAG TPA: hypothetical protein VGK32_17310 [Vicinamibacterales bacterium]|jgi:hypothetical protein